MNFINKMYNITIIFPRCEIIDLLSYNFGIVTFRTFLKSYSDFEKGLCDD